jgi:hypothetical protein
VSAAPEPSPAGLSDDFAVVDPPRGPETDRAQVIELDRADASVLRVSSTVWHPSAARRSARVTLEGDSQPRELREGDEVGEFTVVAIEPTGVTFGRRGLRFHRKVGQR